jgi:hypothetical protein
MGRADVRLTLAVVATIAPAAFIFAATRSTTRRMTRSSELRMRAG